MKKFLSFVVLFCAVQVSTVFTACDEKTLDPLDGASLQAALVSADVDAVTIRLTSSVLDEYAYVVKSSTESAPVASDIFATGVTGAITSTSQELTILDLIPETAYKVYIAGRVGGGNDIYPEVRAVAFTTSAEDPSIVATISDTPAADASPATSVTLNVATKKIKEVAILAVKRSEASTVPAAAVVYAKGTKMEVVQGDNTAVIGSLTPNTEYVIYLTGVIAANDELLDVVTLEGVVTGDFTDAVTLFDVDTRSFKVNIKPVLTDPTNVIKWGTTDLAMYNLNIAVYGSNDAMMMNLNDSYYHNYFASDTTLVFDEEHSYYYSEEWDDYLQYYDPLIPGQPQIVMFGEFAYEEDEEKHGFWGWGGGYYIPLFDEDAYYDAIGGGGGFDLLATPRSEFVTEAKAGIDQSPYWSGFYKYINLVLAEPEQLDAEVKVDINLLPNGGGAITLTPDEGVDRYCMAVLDDNTYQMVIEDMFNGSDAYIQWYVTSYNAMFNIGAMTLEGPVAFNLQDMFYSVDRDATYHLLITAMKDSSEGASDGASQSFVHKTFTLPEPTLPAPTIKVEAIANPSGEESPYEVWFNLKCTSGDATEAMYNANYEREWNTSGYESDEALLMANGYPFDEAEIAAINSAAGLDVSFYTREDAVTVFGAIVANVEGTYSAAATAQQRSARASFPDRVESDLFNSLQGDWTATTHTVVSRYDENYKLVYDTVTKVSKVTIGDVTYPATLTDDVYDIYFNNTVYKTKEEVDAQYELFKQAVDVFNEKTRGNNRLLCNGFDFETSQPVCSSYADPYDLWTSVTYNGYDNESTVWDFGPKWYLEIAADGSVTAPFNLNSFAPASMWARYYGRVREYYFAASSGSAVLPYAYGTDGETGHFPVEVSADGNTVTVKPLVQSVNGEDQTFYPVLVIPYYGSYQLPAQVVSEVVLTRGWSDASTSANAGINSVSKPVNIDGIGRISPVARPKSRTAIAKPVQYKTIEAKAVTADQFKANIKEYVDKARTAKAARR